MLAIVLTIAMPMPAQAATKNITISSKTSDLTVTKVKSNKYNVTVTVGVKNAQLIAKSGKKNVSKSCTWKSSNKKVVTVKSNKLTAKKAGKCKVTVTYKGKKTVLNVTVINPVAPTPTPTPAPAPCDHNWYEHWVVFETSGDEPAEQYMCICNCGIFTTENDALIHQQRLILGTPYSTELEKMCGIHGTKAKGTSGINIYWTEDGTQMCHYWIRTEYIDYMECTKCGTRITKNTTHPDI